mmetsp:Transcript_11939/g.28106  ORF Transcript_11939/g.28106 Transcript_11939/m.28106 type:complete len:246 (-) Transcript_11939:170-907(-)
MTALEGAEEQSGGVRDTLVDEPVAHGVGGVLLDVGVVHIVVAHRQTPTDQNEQHHHPHHDEHHDLCGFLLGAGLHVGVGLYELEVIKDGVEVEGGEVGEVEARALQRVAQRQLRHEAAFLRPPPRGHSVEATHIDGHKARPRGSHGVCGETATCAGGRRTQPQLEPDGRRVQSRHSELLTCRVLQLDADDVGALRCAGTRQRGLVGKGVHLRLQLHDDDGHVARCARGDLRPGHDAPRTTERRAA